MTTTSRDTGLVHQIATLVGLDLRRMLTSRKTVALGIVQGLVVAAALMMVWWGGQDGNYVWSTVVDAVVAPLLVPLVAIFYGAPLLVDEMEQRTLTYLTLRPIPKAGLFMGKWLSGTILASGLVAGPLLLLWAGCLAPSMGVVETLDNLVVLLVACQLGLMAYTAIFATLGAAFASSLFASILYYVIVEMIFGRVPMLEVLAVGFHIETAAGLSDAGGTQLLQSMLQGVSLGVPWWGSMLLLGVVAVGALGVGAATFTMRNYHV